jgi:hypothetical protein
MNRRKALLSIFAVCLILALFASCGANVPVTDPIAITKSLFDNINKGKAEAAATLFSEDGELVTGFGQPTGQTKIKGFFQATVIPLKMHLEMKEINISNGTVIGAFVIQDKGEFKTPTLMEVNAVVQTGKIKSMTWSVKK